MAKSLPITADDDEEEVRGLVRMWKVSVFGGMRVCLSLFGEILMRFS